LLCWAIERGSGQCGAGTRAGATMAVTFESEFWWDPASQTVKFYAHFEGQKIHCAVSRPALETFAALGGMTGPELERLFGEHRQNLEERAAEKIRNHRFDNGNKILIKAADLK
jgi:hypothetical protein